MFSLEKKKSPVSIETNALSGKSRKESSQNIAEMNGPVKIRYTNERVNGDQCKCDARRGWKE